MKRTIWIFCGLAAALGLGCHGNGGASLTGSGSTFIQPMMEKWADVYKQEKNVAVNYQGIGSTAGIKQMTDNSTDFGCTDAPMTPEQIATAEKAGGPVLHVPLVMGGVVPAYNLEGITQPVRFTGPVLAEIFLGKITNWNDPQLQALQEKGVKLPDKAIVTVHRAEGSGTTFIFTDYLATVSEAWKQQVGKGNATVNWPVGGGQPGNPGVANFVKRTEGAIGYVELIYALKNKIQYGLVQNKAGKYVQATLASVTEAAKNMLAHAPPEDLRYSLNDAPGDGSYPICGTTWAVLYQRQPADRGPVVKDFLTWATHAGQEYNAKLFYARLPDNLVKLIDAKLASIQIGH